MPNSGTVTAGSAALASQYNNLRDDVLNTSTGHTHTGASENGARVEGTALKATGVTDGYVLTADGSNGVAWEALAAAGADVQEFTSSGSWVKPAGKTAVYVLAIAGGGGGGGGGRFDTSDSIASGGCGGAGANHLSRWFKASELAGTVTVTIGAGGAGGTSAATETAGNTNQTGGNGSTGGDTTFGTAVVAKGGKGGIFGYSGSYTNQIAQGLGNPLVMAYNNDSGTDTVGEGLSNVDLYSGTVTYNRYLAGLGVGFRSGGALGYASLDNQFGCAGGGGGGGRNNDGPATGAGGSGGRGFGLKANAAALGGNAGSSGNATAGANAGTATPYLGNGGAGGGGANGVAGVYNGGNGGAGVRGGGGGGGGGVRTSTNSVKSGRGGAGGDGYMLVISV